MQREPEDTGWMVSAISARARTASLQGRLSHPIELGWEKLWDANCDLTSNFALSTQQTADFLVDTEFDMFNDFPANVEKVLVEAEAAGPVSVCSPSDPASTNLPLPTVPTSAACTRNRKACVQRTSADRVYCSIKMCPE